MKPNRVLRFIGWRIVHRLGRVDPLAIYRFDLEPAFFLLFSFLLSNLEYISALMQEQTERYSFIYFCLARHYDLGVIMKGGIDSHSRDDCG